MSESRSAILEKVDARHDELVTRVSTSNLAVSERNKLQKELSWLSSIKDQMGKVVSLEGKIRESTQHAEENTDAELSELFADELKELSSELQAEEGRLDDLLFPPASEDKGNVFLEIRPGTGGQEAALFAADLCRMYTNYALNKGWRVDLISSGVTDIGGIKEAILHVRGKGAFGALKYESGVHRVQRVPKTETSGRIHTSTATVAAMPEVEESEVEISTSDLRIDVYRASGAGGQHVNVTDSAVRITHIPTGVVVSCQDERSQHKNKNKAMKILRSRISAATKEKQEAETSQKRKQMIGGGMRSEKIRTYNYPQNRVTDHRIGLTLKKLDLVLEGDLGDIFDAISLEDRRLRRSELLNLGSD